MTFSPEHLLKILADYPRPRRYRIAFSGGMDSSVLLHALVSLGDRLGAPLEALHVDHGLHPDSGQWSAHCTAFCETRSVPLTTCRVDARHRPGESPEAAARRARYAALKGQLDEEDMLLTAHHRDDQAETLLIQLFRGAGPHGLAAMPPQRPFGRALLLRPLLDFSREALLAYARAQQLEWIDDPSNFDTGLERNYLRHELIPAIKQRKPAVSAVLARSATHFAEAAELLDELAHQDLHALVGSLRAELPVDRLQALEPARRRNLLRYWLRALDLPLPDTAHLLRIEQEVLAAAVDAMPRVMWRGAEVRRYRNRLFAMLPLAEDRPEGDLAWSGEGAFDLPARLGTLGITSRTGEGIITRAWRQAAVTVRFRQGGERCVPTHRGHHHQLKKLFQEYGVPPWWRERWPLIYLNGELAAVPGLFTCEPFSAKGDEAGIVINWSGSGIANPSEKQDND